MASTSQLTLESIHVNKAVNALFARKDSISIRFSVQLNIERPTKSQGDGCWVNISGDRNKVQEAKTYIKCLCDPEDIGTAHYPGDLHGFLSDRSLVCNLEQEYKVIIEFKDGEKEDDPGEAIIKGETLSVALALSAIEDLIASNQPKNDLSAVGSSSRSYSDETSNKLNHSLKDMSDKGGIKLENEEVAHYSDVMKKLVLSWAAGASGEQEIIDLEALNSDSEESASLTGPSASNFKSTNSHVKVEPITALPHTSKRSGAAYVDLTAPVDKVEWSDNDDDSVLCVRAQQAISGASRKGSSQSGPSYVSTPSSSSPSYPRSTNYDRITRSKSSPTTDISTITLDDDTSDITELEKFASPQPVSGLENKLVGMAKSKGYDEIEIAMALSECGAELHERKFVSLLNAIRDRRPSTSTSSAKQEAKPTPARRNIAMESINKRQIQPSSPTSKAVMPTEKRVKTVPSVPAASPRSAPLSSFIQHQQPIERYTQGVHPQPSHYNALTNNGSMATVAGPSHSQAQRMPYNSQPVNPPVTYNQLSMPNYNPAIIGQRPAHPAEMMGAGQYRPQLNQQPPVQQQFESLPPELPNKPPLQTRMVVLDGSNIAFAHGKKFYGHEKFFSSQGILLAINYLRSTYGATSENIKAIVPNFRRSDRMTKDPQLLDQMETSQYLVFSPCKTMPGGKKIVPYDDRFILDLAVATNGVVLSNDKYADLLTEQGGKYLDVINNRVIMFMFVNDLFMIPEDPMGRNGPSLDQLLRLPGQKAISKPAKRTVIEPISVQPQPNHNRFTPLSVTSLLAEERTQSETSALKTQLLEMFPRKARDIQQLLSRHPHEKTADIFVDKLV
ncbi:NEDD4-binding protein 1-like [Watersipora subatra]|uniref:NEDD4-binding protein 1-like n=1 Tax=Watersipora subatra TaxID=2589382 RepID=UPI00355ADF97